MDNTPYKIYNASAGSGKTYTLAKEYLKIVLSSSQTKVYAQILAITFTNKAVNEMKQRILENLQDFSNKTILNSPSNLFNDVSKELKLAPEELQKRAKKVHKNILHNYAFFDVSTIDKFTHRLIRTFAKDLKIPQNFEVVLDTEYLLAEAVDRLIAKAGTDKLLTTTLLDFTLEKIDDDKSWDIAFDLNQIGKLLFNENNLASIKKIQNKSITDFIELKKILRSNIKTIEKKTVAITALILETIESKGLEFADFSSSYFPKFILKINQGDLTPDFKAGWKQNFDSKTLYNKSCSNDIKSTLDGLHPQFIDQFNDIKINLYQRAFYQNCYNNIVPLTVLNEIQKEITAICTERDQLTLASFNSIISKEIIDQPAPFIYERLGEKYRHYFVDEFQDTSQLQWKNLIPLVANALESEFELGKKGSLFLVGDTKQAIYRWRGGKAEQFLNLVNKTTSPFVFEPVIENLPKNFRSSKEIVNFNNNFFTTVAPYFGNAQYEQLYVDGNKQEFTKTTEGLVQLSFIPNEKEQVDDDLYCAEVLQTIETVINQKKYNYKDICILVRSNSKGTVLADFLNEKEIPLISAESLLLQSSKKVLFLVNLLKYSLQPNDKDTRFNLLYFLSVNKENVHSFIIEHIDSLDGFLSKEYGFFMNALKKLSVYDGLEVAIHQFNLSKNSDAYIVNFMDEVFEFEQKEGVDVQTFLSFWEKKKEKLSLKAPDKINAAQIMTVHKSKGLEFPIVIFPFANSEIYSIKNLKSWIPVNPESFHGFSELLVSHKNEMAFYGGIPAQIYAEEQTKLELDAFNVLYVALTRAEKALFIIGKKDVSTKGMPNTKRYSGLFIDYLQKQGLWKEDSLYYNFGALQPNIEEKQTQENKHINYIYTTKDRPSFNILAKSGVLWDTDRETALLQGNLMHHILSFIKTEKDINSTLQIFKRNGDVSENEIPILKAKIESVVKHPELIPYYNEGIIVKNEKDIITAEGVVLRPDRVVINENQAVVIDYKTGNNNKSYHQQVIEYADALETMGYTIAKKIIIYINKTIALEYIP